jgi:IS5 family transposase
MLQYMYELSDQEVLQNWQCNSAFQAFTGEQNYRCKLPCDRTTLIAFKKRIGDKGATFLLSGSIKLHCPKGITTESVGAIVSIDSTAQPKYTAYPTDIKLALDVIKQVQTIAKDTFIMFEKDYTEQINSLKKEAFYTKGKKRNEVRAAVLEELRAIASQLLNELKDKLSQNLFYTHSVLAKEHEIKFAIFERAITQLPADNHKIYSIYEPQNQCLIKGKQGVKAEFGSKVSVIVSPKLGIILSIQSLDGNPYDGHTVSDSLLNLSKITGGYQPEIMVADKGYRKVIVGDKIKFYWPTNSDKILPEDQKIIKRQFMKDRISIEAYISHMKTDHKLNRNYLRGVTGDKINAIMAAVGFNLMKYANSATRKMKQSNLCLLRNKRQNLKRSKISPLSMSRHTLFGELLN